LAVKKKIRYFKIFSIDYDKITFYGFINTDGFVKSPDAALCCILRLSPAAYCGVPLGTPHCSGFARLACECFTKSSQF